MCGMTASRLLAQKSSAIDFVQVSSRAQKAFFLALHGAFHSAAHFTRHCIQQ
jgi:hypothetical protein